MFGELIEGGDDIDTWSLEDLKEVVTKFIQIQSGNVGAILISQAVGGPMRKQTDPSDNPDFVPNMPVNSPAEVSTRCVIESIGNEG